MNEKATSRTVGAGWGGTMRHGVRFLGSVAAVALALGGGACAQRPVSPMDIPPHPWIATMIDGEPAAPGVRSTMRVEGTRISGSGGCNRYSGNLLDDGGHVRPVQVAATRMACPPPQDRQDLRFFRALGRTERLAMQGDDLVLLDKDGVPLIRFIPTERE